MLPIYRPNRTRGQEQATGKARGKEPFGIPQILIVDQ